MNVESAEEFAGTPDMFERLWTPHRMVYIAGENKPTDKGPQTCPFCLVPKRSDADGLIVARGELAFVVMNLYPYSPGHVLVCPYRHVAEYHELSAAEAGEVASLTAEALRTLRRVSNPGGFNVGMNLGDVAGAGIGGHLHQHVVPRWSGDSNFLPVIAQTKSLPQLLEQTRLLLVAAWGQAEQS